MAYLVDTNVMVDFTRGNVEAGDYLDSIRGACKLSSITALELIAGARNQREVADLDIMISDYEQIAPTEEIMRRAYYLMKGACQVRWLAHARCADRRHRARRWPHARDEEPKAFPDDR